MEIFWYGHSCYRITERSMATVVCDPYDHRVVGFDALKLKADIVTVSNPTPDHSFLAGVKGYSFEVSSPGEYEIGGVFITGVQTNGFTKKKADEPRNTLFVLDYNGVTIAHLGRLNRVPTQAEVEALGNVNIVLVPVGGEGVLNAAKAAEVISLLEPSLVVPMLYAMPGSTVKFDTLNKFLKEMGLSSTETRPSLKIVRSSDLPDETQVVILDIQKGS